MSQQVPWITSQQVRLHALRDAHGRLCVPAHLTESIGEIGRFRIGRRTVVVVNSAELTRSALADHADAFVPMSEAGNCAWRLLSNGAVIRGGRLEGDHSGARGRRFAAALHVQANAAAAFAERLCARREAGDEIDLDQEITRLTRWIGVKRLLELDDMPDVADEIAAALNTYGLSANRQPAIDPTGVRSQRRDRRGRSSIQRIRAALYRAIRELRRSGAPGAGSLLVALAGERPATALEDIDAALSMELSCALVLSLETIWSVMSRVWTLLSEYPVVASRLQQELDGTLNGRTPRYGDLRRLPYALNVVRESLRLNPPVVMFSRRLAHDVQLGEYHVPAGAIVVFNTRRVHRCADRFASPDLFNPDRFASDGKSTRPSIGELALGDPAGTSVERYVWSVAHIVLATMAQRVVLVPNGATYTVAALRSSRRQDKRIHLRTPRRNRRSLRAVGAGASPAAVRGGIRPVNVHEADTKADAGGAASAILTCEALRAAL